MSRAGLLHVCTENPRYFADGSGRAVYLTGSHTWNNLSEQLRAGLFDYGRYLDWLARYNHNFFRLWALDVFTTPDEGDNDVLPYARTGPGLACDGRPRFDLTRFDPAYFQRLRSRVAAAGERGIYVGIMLFEGWWIWAWKEEGWRGHPFNPANNVNGIPAGRLQLHTLGDSRIMELQEAYVRHVLETVNDLDNVLYEIANEDGAGTAEWQSHFVAFIRRYSEKDGAKVHPIGMTFRQPYGTNAELFGSDADWVSPNICGPDGYSYKHNPPPADGRKVILTDTDHIQPAGLGPEWVWKSFTRGLNPIYMEDHDLFTTDLPARQAMGQTRRYAERMDLVNMEPVERVASTRFCLAHRRGREYLVYQPDSGPFTIDLTHSKRVYDMEWLDLHSGNVQPGRERVAGGALRTLVPPTGGDVVAYLWAPEG